MSKRHRIARLWLTGALLLVSALAAQFSDPPAARADDNTTFCKWDFGHWYPNTVRYLAWVGDTSYDFTAGEAYRVQRGADSWLASNSRLVLHRVYTDADTTNSSWVEKGDMSVAGRLAETYITPNPFVPNACNRDTGRPISRVYTWFSRAKVWHEDCAAVYPACQTYDWYDVHDTATHEFGHWFFMHESGNPGSSMTGGWAGSTFARDINDHDGRSARIMYGSR